MANNRMYLVYQPTGLAVGIGKRMGWGWYVGTAPDLARFYDTAIAECEGDQDDFVLVRESDPDWTFVERLEHGLFRMKKTMP